MEDEALYRAILAAPHNDTPRLVYADWLDEHADGLPEIAARTRRARAEFIRLQCTIARSGGAPDSALLRREKRLLFTQGRKWRREYPAWLASSRFDRGFPHPRHSFRPTEFLVAGESRFGERRFFGVLMPDHPAHRYLVDGDYFALAPLWDVHLYATGYRDDPDADRGQYGPLLAEIARSPALERIGWLKVSFFRTPVAEFLRMGKFTNVETLVLNCGPFPEVLEAVAENESFRNLRYVQFGDDRWAWVGEFASFIRYAAIAKKLDGANKRHLPYGAMRAELRTILGQAAVEPVPPHLAPLLTPPVPRIPLPTVASGAESASYAAGAIGCLLGGCLLGGALVFLGDSVRLGPRAPMVPTIRVPDFKPVEVPLPDPAVMKILEEMNAEREAAAKRKDR